MVFSFKWTKLFWGWSPKFLHVRIRAKKLRCVELERKPEIRVPALKLWLSEELWWVFKSVCSAYGLKSRHFFCVATSFTIPCKNWKVFCGEVKQNSFSCNADKSINVWFSVWLLPLQVPFWW